MSADGFTKWQPLDAGYIDPMDIHAAMFAQSAQTVDGHVAEFRIEPTVPANAGEEL